MSGFTPDQRAAIEDRSGSRLLAANAGSGKTAVMVERFVEAVLRDGVPVSGILALTFTEKAAGELRERIRRRFAALGEDDHARAAEGAWTGTIHGFCARVLRAHPFAGGLDPRFTVLDDPAARRLQQDAWERAVERWSRDEGAIDLLAAHGALELRGIVAGAYEELRSRGQRVPRLPVPPRPPAPDPAPLLAALPAAEACLEAGNGGARVQEGREALAACRAALARAAGVAGDAAGGAADGGGAAAPGGGATPPGGGAANIGGGAVLRPADLDAAALGRAAKPLKEPPCDAYREALAAFRQACADHHAQPALALLDRLLAAFASAYEDLKAARAVVDFEDLQLGVRDLFANASALRSRWAERFALIMVDEFQDTNRLQLDILELLERDNLFAVGDEFQSIYGFRHADVTIFRERAARGGVRRLRTNFRSREELLDVLNGAFAPIFGAGFEPLEAGRADAPPEGRLFDPDNVDTPAGGPPVELLITGMAGWEDADLGRGPPDQQPWRRAEARLVAQRLREEIERGRRPGEIAVLVRAAASLRAIEQALEDHGIATYVVGGRGYWSQEQVRDGLAYLRTLANPLDEESLYATLASPFAGVGADALILTARAGREVGGAWAALTGSGAWMRDLPDDDRDRLARAIPLLAAERERAERLSAEVLLERAIAATGYDTTVLARPGGERRLANLRKLMRLAREYERAEGRDLRSFLAFAADQDLSGAREGEAAMESEGLDAVRLMTIHRAKGLEFPVVCVADLGRLGPGATPPLLLGADGRAGLRVRTLGAATGVPALDYEALTAERARAEDAEERRLLYVAMTRAEDLLILSGGIDLNRAEGEVGGLPAARPGGAPLAWIARALLDGPIADQERTFEGRPARLTTRVNTPEAALLTPPPAVRPSSAGTSLPVAPVLAPTPPSAPAALPAAPARLSYSSLGEYGRCAYRWYLRRVLRLPSVKPPPPTAAPESPRPITSGLDPMTRGSLVHVLLEDLDFDRPQPPSPDEVVDLAAGWDVELTAAETDDVQRLVAAFASSPLCARLAAAHTIRREAPFAYPLEPGAPGVLVNGVVDVHATEDDGVLVVDYKTDPLDDLEPEALVTRDYAPQRLVYALAALKGGAPSAEVAHCFLERPGDPATATYTQSDVPALAEQLVGLAGGLLAGRFPVTEDPHRELCGSCPGREALCSQPESLTLRER